MSPLYPRPHSVPEVTESANDVDKAGQHPLSGVHRIEAIANLLGPGRQASIFCAIFLLAYCYSLDSAVRANYEIFAVSAYSSSAQISTVSLVRGISAATAQTFFAKIADRRGRSSILGVSAILYCIGTAIQASARGLGAFCAGAAVYQLGRTGAQLLVEVLIADLTTLKSRLLFTVIPSTPIFINSWITGNVVNVVIQSANWRWGIAWMWGIIFPICCLPLHVCLAIAENDAIRRGQISKRHPQMTWVRDRTIWTNIFWETDTIGLLLISGALCCGLIPLTLAGGIVTDWSSVRTITPLATGWALLLPLFIAWEVKYARHPFAPLDVLRQRQIVCGLCIGFLSNAGWSTQGNYLGFLLLVTFSKRVQVFNRVLSVFPLVSTVVGIALGLYVRYHRKLKWVIVLGTVTSLGGFALVFNFHSGPTDFTGLVSAQAVLGLSSGLLALPMQTLLQATVAHDQLALVTSLYLSSRAVGSVFGNTIAACIWTGLLPRHPATELRAIGINDHGLVDQLYASPFNILRYSPENPIHILTADAYANMFRPMVITSMVLSGIAIVIGLAINDTALPDSQSIYSRPIDLSTIPMEASHTDKESK